MSSLPTPKDRFTALDTLAVVQELRALGPAHLDKAFDVPGGGWSIVVRAPGAGRRELVFVPGRYAALLAEGPEHSEVLSPVAKELRRLLTGATLRRALDPGGERILQLIWGRAADPAELLLVLEIFGAGNLLVVREGKIVLAAFPRRWAHRTVRAGSEYVPPPARADPWTLPISEIAEELARSRTDIASTLAARLALGGPIAEELIARRGWNPSEAAAPRSPELAPKLHAELARLLSEVGDRPAGFLYVQEGAPVDATPYASVRWKEVSGAIESQRHTFSEAAQEYFATMIRAAPSPAESASRKARESLERLLEQQPVAVRELAASIEQLKAQAEAIYAHYPEAEAALAAPVPEGASSGTVEVTLGGTLVPLLRGQDPRSSAQSLFEEAKRTLGLTALDIERARPSHSAKQRVKSKRNKP